MYYEITVLPILHATVFITDSDPNAKQRAAPSMKCIIPQATLAKAVKKNLILKKTLAKTITWLVRGDFAYSSRIMKGQVRVRECVSIQGEDVDQQKCVCVDLRRKSRTGVQDGAKAVRR